LTDKDEVDSSVTSSVTSSAEEHEVDAAVVDDESMTSSLVTSWTVVEVPRVDDDVLMTSFCTSSKSVDDKQDASIDTFNDIFIDSNDMCVYNYTVGHQNTPEYFCA